MATEEKLIPVRSESELRVGMKVVIKGCIANLGTGSGSCGRSHCGMVLALNAPALRYGKEVPGFRATFRCALGAKVRHSIGDQNLGVAWLCIPEGRLFRVEDGLDEKADERQRKLDEAALYAKELELVK